MRLKERPPHRPVNSGSWRRDDAGFTLLELLVAIVVLGILSSVVVFALQGVRTSAASAACQSDFATTLLAVNAYRAEMGGYPGGSGSAVVTDSDPGTTPNWTSGEAPSGANAARSGGELLVAGTSSPNTGNANVGPWIREAPDNPGNYSIWVANDGSGTIQVLDMAGNVPSDPTHTAVDCNAVNSPDGATTTSDPTTTTTVPPTTSTTTVPPTTSTTSTTTLPSTTTTTTIPARVPPEFTSETSATFRRGVFGSFTVVVSGTPEPSIKVSGGLPSGLTFNRTNDTISGTPKKSGVYNLKFSATNGVSPNSTQGFTLTVE